MMKRLLIIGTAVVLAVPGPPANADELGFLTDIKEAGFGSDDGNGALIEAGRRMCGSLNSGATPEQVAEHFFETSQLNSLARARRFVNIVQQDLCTT